MQRSYVRGRAHLHSSGGIVHERARRMNTDRSDRSVSPTFPMPARHCGRHLAGARRVPGRWLERAAARTHRGA